MQLAHPKVAQPNPGVFRPQVCLRWTNPRPTRSPDGGGKANSKLMQSAFLPKRLGEEGDLQGIVLEIKISVYKQMVFAQTRICH